MGHNADRLKLGQRFGTTVEALAEPTIVSGILRRRKAVVSAFLRAGRFLGLLSNTWRELFQ
jgi:hypothetical protein